MQLCLYTGVRVRVRYWNAIMFVYPAPALSSLLAILVKYQNLDQFKHHDVEILQYEISNGISYIQY